MSTSKTTNKKKSSSSSSSVVRDRNQWGQRNFPRIVTSTAPGSPPGVNPPVVNTIPMMFNAIASSAAGTPGVINPVLNPPILTGGGPPAVGSQLALTKTQKAIITAERHASTRQRLIDWIAPPPSHLDEFRTMPAAQLALLSDPDLVKQALLVMTVKNPKGSIVHDDGTGVLVEQLLKEFASNAKSRDGNAIRAQLRGHRKALEAIAMVDRYASRYGSRPGSIQESINEDDDDLFSSSRSDYGDHFPSLSEALSAVGGKKAKHGARSKSTQSKPSKRSTQSTLAIATAGINNKFGSNTKDNMSLPTVLASMN